MKLGRRCVLSCTTQSEVSFRNAFLQESDNNNVDPIEVADVTDSTIKDINYKAVSVGGKFPSRRSFPWMAIDFGNFRSS